MKRKTIVRIHLTANIAGAILIIVFFVLSLIAEIHGNENFIKQVKEGILYSLPLLIFTMASLNFSGRKLATGLNNSMIAVKQKRMKFVLINGIFLTFIAAFLYHRAFYVGIDKTFFAAQIVEFILGLTNLLLIALNAKDGFRLSGRIKPDNKF